LPSSNDGIGFYRAFEERFRGSRELIKNRLRFYEPLLREIKSIDENPNALDLGCGRGEWLEILNENGLTAKGVDRDDGMLNACIELGLNVVSGDALSFMKSIASDSQLVVSGFHIAEHLDQAYLEAMVEQALRILKPEGLLILETPNPENIWVSSVTFHLDPTHVHPLPPDMLEFLVEYVGFGRSKVVRLQEPRANYAVESITLLDVLKGSSLDYAVVSQKGSAAKAFTICDGFFSREFGVTTESLGSLFETRVVEIENRAKAASQALEVSRELVASSQSIVDAVTGYEGLLQGMERLQLEFAEQTQGLLHVESVQSRLVREFGDFKGALMETVTKMEGRVIESEARAAEAIQLSRTILSSRSWRVTYPLRVFGKFLRWLKNGTIAWVTFTPASRPRRYTRKLIMHFRAQLESSPKAKSVVLSLLSRAPRLKQRLKAIGRAPSEEYTTVIYRPNDGDVLHDMSEDEKRIYLMLKYSLSKNKAGKGESFDENRD
jgi:O-antigen chain-terminating methyltransferase